MTLEKRKKEEMIPNLLARPLERPIKTNDPLESPTLPGEKRREEWSWNEMYTGCTKRAPLVRIAFQPWLVHLLRTKRWHPPTLRGNQTCRGKLLDRMTSGPSFHVSSSKNYQTLYSIARNLSSIFSTRVGSSLKPNVNLYLYRYLWLNSYLHINLLTLGLLFENF